MPPPDARLPAALAALPSRAHWRKTPPQGLRPSRFKRAATLARLNGTLRPLALRKPHAR